MELTGDSKKEDAGKMHNFTKAKPEETDLPKETANKWHRGNCFFRETCTLPLFNVNKRLY